MTSLVQELYWKAPSFLKSWLASWNARKLDRWRHGPEYERSFEEISKRGSWSRRQFLEYQEGKLREIIAIATEHVPFYREQWSKLGLDASSIRSLDDLAKLPILEKSSVRANPWSLVAETYDRSKLMVAHTSGTTGTPLDLYRDVWHESTRFAYLHARWQMIAGMRRRVNRSVSIGKHLVTAPGRREPPFWVHNRRWKQLYMSSYHLSSKHLGDYVEAIREFGADYIEGYPSSVYAIAYHIVENKLRPVAMRACYTTAEALLGHQREAIRQAFGCRTYDQYGCGEQVVFAAECEEGSMHISPDVGFVEVVDDEDKPLPPGRTGQLICTSLMNHVQPFIRYRLGDIGALSESDCRCGSAMPVLARIEGRTGDVLITRDGRRIGRVGPIFKGAAGIVEAQVVQDDLDKFRIRIVPGADYSQDDGKTIVRNLADRLGRADIRVELVDQIERTKAGKFRTVVCNVRGEGRT